MKVLYFSRDYTPHDHRFLTALAESDWEVAYLRLEKRGHAQESRMLPPEVRLVSWEGGQEPFDRVDHRHLLGSLRKVLRQEKPDVIHAGPVQTSAWLAAQTGFQPLVTMSWGSDLLVDADTSAQMRRLTEFTLAHTNVLVGDCHAVRQKAVELGFFDERIVTFPWGVNLEHYSPDGGESDLRARPGWQDDFVILHTRSWEPVYGVDVFARAFVQAARLVLDLRLFMLGNGSLAPEVRRILMPVMDQVQFAGQVRQEKLPDYYRAADLYVSASHSDGSSVSLMEALASGLPVLVSDIPGNREWVEDTDVGWLFPDGDASALAAGILQLHADRPQLDSYVKNARRLAEERANWRKNFEKLLGAYQMAVEAVKR
ncbi:MAG: glycosyltransferase family 4 protein [Anaerolineales bacterium]|jgi:glycosyltransferase involved in cell wall biosynthesis